MSTLLAPNLVFQAGADHDLPVAIGAPRYDEPLLPDYNGILTLRQDYISNLPVSSANLNSTYPGDGVTAAQSDYYLVDESSREDAGGYKVKWTRTWARVPNTHTKPGGVFYYSFPGLASKPNRQTPTLPMGVACDIVREFFLIGAGQTYETFDELVAAKLKKAQAYYAPSTPGDPPDPDNLLTGDNIILDSTTSPTEAEWIDLITPSPTHPRGQKIIPKDSEIYRWMGNIFVVDTMYIYAR